MRRGYPGGLKSAKQNGYYLLATEKRKQDATEPMRLLIIMKSGLKVFGPHSAALYFCE